MVLYQNLNSPLRWLTVAVPFLSFVFYPFLDVYIYFILNLLIFALFLWFGYNLLTSQRIILPVGFSYLFYFFLIYLISYGLSPIRSIISAEYVNFISGFLMFLVVLNTKELEIKFYYPFFVLMLLVFIVDSFYDIGISSRGNLNLFAFVFLIAMGILLRERRYLFAAVFFVAVLFTRSYAAVLSILFSSFWYAYDNRKNIDIKNTKVVIFILLFLLGFLIANIEPSSVLDRLLWWKAAVRIFLERPFIGWGYSSFTHIVSSFLPSGLRTIYTHNYFLTLLAEGGIFAFVFWVLFLYKAITHANSFDKYLLIALVVHSIFDIGPETMCGWWLFMFYLALSCKNNSYIGILPRNYLKATKLAILLFVIVVFKFISFSYSLFYVDRVIKNSVKLISHSNYDEAINLAEEAVKRYPSNIDLASNRAFVYLQGLRYNSSLFPHYLKSLEYILLINPYRRDIYYALMENYKKMDQRLVLELSNRMKQYLKD